MNETEISYTVKCAEGTFTGTAKTLAAARRKARKENPYANSPSRIVYTQDGTIIASEEDTYGNGTWLDTNGREY